VTREEALAANVVVRWAFNQWPPRRAGWDPEVLQAALETLAAGAHRRLGSGIDRTAVRNWAART
jgi:hypothetical protein